MYRETNPRVLENQKKIDEIKNRFYPALDRNDLADIKKLIEEAGIVCPMVRASGFANSTTNGAR